MGILSWIIFGLIAGILAKWIMPGKRWRRIYRDRYFGDHRRRGRRLDQYPVWFWQGRWV